MSGSQRPPNWEREEVLLGLDVYFRHGRRQLSQDHPAMQRLHEELRAIAPEVHPKHDPSPKFRNLDGLSYKFGGYIGLDPNHSASGTKHSQLEAEVFEEFLSDPELAHLETLVSREELGLASQTDRWWASRNEEAWDPQERVWIEITDRSDLGADLRAPRYDRGGDENWRYTLLLDVRPGDTIYHYDKNDQAIVAQSTAESWAQDQPVVWAARGTYGREDEPRERSGLVVELGGFNRLDEPVTLSAIRHAAEGLQSTHEALSERHGGSLYLPFSIHEDGEIRPNQVYLAKLPSAYFELFPSLRPFGQGAEGLRNDRTAQTTGENGNQADQDSAGPPAGQLSSHQGGQGYSSTAEERDAIEAASMQAAREHFESEGFRVEDRSATSPYDLLCQRSTDGSGEERLYVEVKGTVTDGSSVHLTRGEVKHAREHEGQVALFILKRMELVEGEDEPKARGGEKEIQWPWKIDEGRLESTQYKYYLD